MDYYHILGVPRHANAQAIKLAYRKLAKDLHPDRNQHDPFAQDLFKRINEAYQTLSRPELRKHYDETLAGAASQKVSPGGEAANIEAEVRKFAAQLEAQLKPLPFDWRKLPESHYILVGCVSAFCVSQSFASFELTLLVWTYWFSYAALTSYWVNRLRVGDPEVHARLWGSVLAVHLISLPISFVFSFPLVVLLGYLNLTFGR